MGFSGTEADMARIRIQTEDFDAGAEIAAITAGRTEIGGIGCFIGTVRDNPGISDAPGAHPVTAMTLEHYPAMTERAIERIVAEAEGRWPLLGCTVIHRVGRLQAGDNIVLVVAASSHRQAALEATAFLIDWLKTKAPFWKLEETPKGEHWVEAHSDDDDAARKWENG